MLGRDSQVKPDGACINQAKQFSAAINNFTDRCHASNDLTLQRGDDSNQVAVVRIIRQHVEGYIAQTQTSNVRLRRDTFQTPQKLKIDTDTKITECAGDPIDLARKMERLQSSPDLRAALSENAHESVRKSFSWDVVGHQFESLYYSLIDPATPTP